MHPYWIAPFDTKGGRHPCTSKFFQREVDTIFFNTNCHELGTNFLHELDINYPYHYFCFCIYSTNNFKECPNGQKSYKSVQIKQIGKRFERFE